MMWFQYFEYSFILFNLLKLFKQFVHIISFILSFQMHNFVINFLLLTEI